MPIIAKTLMKTQFATKKILKEFDKAKKKKISNIVGVHLSLKDTIYVNILWRMIESYCEHLNGYFSFHNQEPSLEI